MFLPYVKPSFDAKEGSTPDISLFDIKPISKDEKPSSVETDKKISNMQNQLQELSEVIGNQTDVSSSQHQNIDKSKLESLEKNMRTLLNKISEAKYSQPCCDERINNAAKLAYKIQDEISGLKGKLKNNSEFDNIDSNDKHLHMVTPFEEELSDKNTNNLEHQAGPLHFHRPKVDIDASQNKRIEAMENMVEKLVQSMSQKNSATSADTNRIPTKLDSQLFKALDEDGTTHDSANNQTINQIFKTHSSDLKSEEAVNPLTGNQNLDFKGGDLNTQEINPIIIQRLKSQGGGLSTENLINSANNEKIRFQDEGGRHAQETVSVPTESQHFKVKGESTQGINNQIDNTMEKPVVINAPITTQKGDISTDVVLGEQILKLENIVNRLNGKIDHLSADISKKPSELEQTTLSRTTTALSTLQGTIDKLTAMIESEEQEEQRNEKTLKEAESTYLDKKIKQLENSMEVLGNKVVQMAKSDLPQKITDTNIKPYFPLGALGALLNDKDSLAKTVVPASNENRKILSGNLDAIEKEFTHITDKIDEGDIPSNKPGSLQIISNPEALTPAIPQISTSDSSSTLPPLLEPAPAEELHNKLVNEILKDTANTFRNISLSESWTAEAYKERSKGYIKDISPQNKSFLSKSSVSQITPNIFKRSGIPYKHKKRHSRRHGSNKKHKKHKRSHKVSHRRTLIIRPAMFHKLMLSKRKRERIRKNHKLHKPVDKIPLKRNLVIRPAGTNRLLEHADMLSNLLAPDNTTAEAVPSDTVSIWSNILDKNTRNTVEEITAANVMPVVERHEEEMPPSIRSLAQADKSTTTDPLSVIASIVKNLPTDPNANSQTSLLNAENVSNPPELAKNVEIEIPPLSNPLTEKQTLGLIGAEQKKVDSSQLSPTDTIQAYKTILSSLDNSSTNSQPKLEPASQIENNINIAEIIKTLQAEEMKSIQGSADQVINPSLVNNHSTSDTTFSITTATTPPPITTTSTTPPPTPGLIDSSKLLEHHPQLQSTEGLDFAGIAALIANLEKQKQLQQNDVLNTSRLSEQLASQKYAIPPFNNSNQNIATSLVRSPPKVDVSTTSKPAVELNSSPTTNQLDIAALVKKIEDAKASQTNPTETASMHASIQGDQLKSSTLSSSSISQLENSLKLIAALSNSKGTSNSQAVNALKESALSQQRMAPAQSRQLENHNNPSLINKIIHEQEMNLLGQGNTIS